MISAKHLTQKSDLIHAKSILHKVYIEELNWDFPKDNPSGIRIRNEDGILILEDNYDIVSNWFGVYYEGKMIGSGRTTHRLDGKFEMEHYTELPREILNQKLSIEASRMAILPKFRGQEVVRSLWGAGIQHELLNGMVLSFSSAPVPGLGDYYINVLGCELVDKKPFKYSPKDRESVSVFKFDMTNMQLINQFNNI